MSPIIGNAIAIIAVAGLLGICLRSIIKQHKSGGCSGCAGGCAGCNKCCHCKPAAGESSK